MSALSVIELDANATAPLHPSAREAILLAIDRPLGNPSSIHRDGQRGRALVEQARRQVAAALVAAPHEVVLTSGATEANVLAWRGILQGRRRQGLPLRALCSAADHPSIAALAAELRRDGVTVSEVATDLSGRMSRDALQAALEPGDVALVQVTAVGSELGTLEEVAAIASLTRAAGAHLHCDAAQAWGRVPLAVHQLGADTVAVSGHKIGGPMGTGALWIAPGRRLIAVAPGHQEQGLRAGTENVLGFAGLGAAAGQLGQQPGSGTALRWLRDRLAAQLAGIDGYHRFGPTAAEQETGHVLCAGFVGVPAPALVMALDLLGVRISAGSACASGTSEPSRLLRQLADRAGLPPQRATEAVRWSLGAGLTAEKIDEAVRRAHQAVAQIRATRLGKPL